MKVTFSTIADTAEVKKTRSLSFATWGWETKVEEWRMCPAEAYEVRSFEGLILPNF